MSFLITMSQKELHRLEVIQKIHDQRLSVVQAARVLRKLKPKGSVITRPLPTLATRPSRDVSAPEWPTALSYSLASGDPQIKELITSHLAECAALVVPIRPNTKDRPNNMQKARHGFMLLTEG